MQPHPWPWSMTTLAARRLCRKGISSRRESGQGVLEEGAACRQVIAVKTFAALRE